ncbi:MAG: sigma-70 family RNA polymerase sigma factor [Planctomycetes bacterium]|nr:sigma-70 family RNA polymerase sigma factor [Planctomycetota bacterium]
MLALRKVLNPSDRADEADWIARSLAGDHGAFAELVRRHQDRLLRLLGRFTRDRGEVEDLAQEVFVKAYRKLHTFQQDSSFYTWLYRIAVNAASDLLSRRSMRRLHLVEDQTHLDPERIEPGHQGALGPLLDEEQRRVVREVLATLPDKYRSILLLREFEDLSYTEIASVLGIQLGTVESRLFRARQRFKDALERLHPDLVPTMRGGHR